LCLEKKKKKNWKSRSSPSRACAALLLITPAHYMHTIAALHPTTMGEKYDEKTAGKQFGEPLVVASLLLAAIYKSARYIMTDTTPCYVLGAWGYGTSV
jgi:hypothetical protein